MVKAKSGLGTLVLAVAFFALGPLWGPGRTFSQQSPSPPGSGAFATPLSDSEIDSGASAEWVDGTTRPLRNPSALRQVVWTQTAAPSGGPLQYGASPNPGVRYLRLGFTHRLDAGSVLVRGGGALSVLKASASYPGDLADDSQWAPASRVTDHGIASAPVDAAHYALWVLPAGTTTRALRFTHTAVSTDSAFAGVLGGVYLLRGRYLNIAPQAMISTSANRPAARLLTDEQYNGWGAWDNGPNFAHAVSAVTPEWIVLSWSRPVSLAGLVALWAGFNAADAEVFAGDDKADVQAAPDSDWRPLGQPVSLHNQYPRPLGVDWIDFGKTVVTRGIRLRMTEATDEVHHPHLAGKTRNGTRIWLGELMALSPLQSDELRSASLPAVTSPASLLPKPPIAVRFTVETPGFVTLVIDDAKGARVRNLVSDTWFDKGPQVVWWDGTDDLGRNEEAAKHGVAMIPTHFVAPGTYRVRGLVHGPIDLRYEFSIYNPGRPAWETADTKGGWLTNHTPPSSALFVPEDKAPGGKPLVYLGSYVSEGGAGLAWVDLNGEKQGGRGWIGGNWTAAPFLARDSGPQADPDVFAYVGAPTGDGNGEGGKAAKAVIRLTGLTRHGDKSIVNFTFDPGMGLERGPGGKIDWTHQMAGLAANNGLVAISLPLQNQLLFVDAKAGKALGRVPVESAHGLAFDAGGRLLVISGKKLLSYALPANLSGVDSQQWPLPEVLIADGLHDPSGITVGANGNIYISDDGDINQVHVYTAAGKLIQSIGHAGPSQAGPYDALHMNHPAGIAIDSVNHLWVTEADFEPKRVSVWTLDGQLVKAFYGPAEYGGGGSLDPQDKTKFYYHGMEFKLDWKTGTNTITNILYRHGNAGKDGDVIPLPNTGAPSTVLYSNGHRYFINSYLGQATNGPTIGTLFLDQGGVLRLVAALGKANDWPLLKQDIFKPYLPAGADLSSNAPEKSVLFTWSDLNGNGRLDPEEVRFVHSTSGAVTIQAASSNGSGPVMLNALVDGKAVRFAPVRVSQMGVPIYDLSKGEVIAQGAQPTASDGGGQVLESPQEAVLTTAPLPYARESIGGIDKQSHSWSYPSLWPGLHPSHSAPLPDHPGELIGTTHVLGSFISPRGSEVHPLWAINGNAGDIYLFTADGLFVSQLFQDGRTGKPWNMPQATRNMLLNDVTLHDETFYPSMTQTPDGNVYLVDGTRTSIVRVDGLDTLRTIAGSSVEITTNDLNKAQSYLKQRESSRQSSSGAEKLVVLVRSGAAPSLKDLVEEQKTSDWAVVDRRIIQQGWNQKPDIVDASISIADGRLYAAFRTNEPNLLVNSGAIPNAPFKTGGALDLMIGTNSKADPGRESAVAGDVRLLVYQVKGKTVATLYRAVVSGTKDSVPFSSPSRTVTLDQVQDVSSLVSLSSSNGTYAFSIPLAALGLKPVAGEQIKADIGILRGSGGQTTQRAYWSNKATGITSDVPSEAELTPNLWGRWIFQVAQ